MAKRTDPTVGPHKRVLGDLLGVIRVIQHPQRYRVHHLLVTKDQGIKRREVSALRPGNECRFVSLLMRHSIGRYCSNSAA